MFTSRFPNRVAAILAILMMTLSSVQPAYAAPSANDRFASATLATKPAGQFAKVWTS